MRRILGILGALVIAGTMWVALSGSGNGQNKNQFWVELDNAFGIVNGGDLKIAGVRPTARWSGSRSTRRASATCAPTCIATSGRSH
jgi:hypothetical protein